MKDIDIMPMPEGVKELVELQHFLERELARAFRVPAKYLGPRDAPESED